MNPDRTRRAPRRLDAEGLWIYAQRALGVRALSAGELRQKLLARAEREEDVAPTLTRLKEYGYINDQKLAEAYSAARLENQGFGKQRVVSDLRKKRIAPHVASKAVEEAYRGSDELELIENYLRRKFRGKELNVFLSEPRNMAGAYRRLRTAGFSGGNAIRVLKRFAADPSLLDSLEGGEEPPE